MNLTAVAPTDPALGVGPGVVARTAVTALAPLVWGTTYLTTTELLPPGHPLFAALLRSLPPGLAVLAHARVLPRGAWWWRAIVLGTLNIGLFLPLLFIAAQRLPGGVAATLGATQPVIVAGLAVVVLDQRASVWRFSWGAAGAVGVGLVVLGPAASLDAVGLAAGLGGAASMACGVTFTKRWPPPRDVSPVAFAGWQLTAGGLVLLALTALVEGSPPSIDASAALGYLWLSVPGALVAYTLWFRGIRSLPVTSVALLALLSPMVAATLGVVVAGETLGVVQAAGFALALAAIVGGQLPSPRRELAPLPQGEQR